MIEELDLKNILQFKDNYVSEIDTVLNVSNIRASDRNNEYYVDLIIRFRNHDELFSKLNRFTVGKRIAIIYHNRIMLQEIHSIFYKRGIDSYASFDANCNCDLLTLKTRGYA